MANVVAGANESFESLLRRFNKKVQEGGILREIRRHERYEKPSVKRKRKEADAKRKAARAASKRNSGGSLYKKTGMTPQKRG